MDIDIAACIEDIFPNAKYQGSVKNKEAFERCRWTDPRQKPKWGAIVAQWATTQARLVREARANNLPDDTAELLEKLIERGSLLAEDITAEKLDAINARREGRGQPPL